MTLTEMSLTYQTNAAAIHGRIVELRNQEKTLTDPDDLFHLRRRISELLPLWREARELAVLTAHYYDRSYHIHALTPEAANGLAISPYGFGKTRRTTANSWTASAGICGGPGNRS